MTTSSVAATSANTGHPDDHVRRFHRDVGVRTAHRKLDVGLRERRRVIDAIVGRSGRAVAFLKVPCRN
jgi:hypothetical protein